MAAVKRKRFAKEAERAAEPTGGFSRGGTLYGDDVVAVDRSRKLKSVTTLGSTADTETLRNIINICTLHLIMILNYL